MRDSLDANSTDPEYLKDVDDIRIVLDRDDYRHITVDCTAVEYDSFLDLTVVRFPFSASLDFLNASVSANEEMFIKSSTWAKPCAGYLAFQEMKGHTYHFGKVANKYDIFIVFQSDVDACDCNTRNEEMHVPEGTKSLIMDTIDAFLLDVSPPSTSYYSSQDNNSYAASSTGFNLKFYSLQKGSFDFNHLRDVNFFRNHTAYWMVTCLGQNDIISDDWNAPILSDLSRLFRLNNRDYLKFSIAINVRPVQGSNMSVILTEAGFKTIICDESTFQFEQYTKVFQSEFSNYQSRMCPLGLDIMLLDYPNFLFESFNWYNGKIICLTFDLAHTTRPSRQLEIGAKHYITSILNEPSDSKRKELFGMAQEERNHLKSMIDYRERTGCSYRLEFTFALTNDPQTDNSQNQTLNLVECLKTYVKDVIRPHLRLVPCNIFPRSIWTIYNYLWNLSFANLKLFVQNGYIKMMEYPKREFIALLDRLMVVCLNGNVQRNLSNWTARQTNLINNIQEKNWPFLDLFYFDLEHLSIVLWTSDANGRRSINCNGDLCLFRYFSGMHKTLVKENLVNLLTLEATSLNFNDPNLQSETVVDEFLPIFSKITKNLLLEIGTLVKEKLERNYVSKKSTYAFKIIYQNISKVNPGAFLRAIAEGTECGSELYVSTSETISTNDLFDFIVVRGDFSSVKGLPDWFRSWASLVTFYLAVNQLAFVDTAALISSCKQEFSRQFGDQKIMIKFDRGVFWRNVGTFYRVGDFLVPEISNVFVNDIGMSVSNVQNASRPRVTRRLPGARSGFNQSKLNNLKPDRFEFWRAEYLRDLPKVEYALAYYLSFPLNRTEFGNFSEQSPQYVKWIILTTFICSELQMLVGYSERISNRTSPFNDKTKYRVAMLCVLLSNYLNLNPQPHMKELWMKYYQNNKINLRYIEHLMIDSNFGCMEIMKRK